MPKEIKAPQADPIPVIFITTVLILDIDSSGGRCARVSKQIGPGFSLSTHGITHQANKSIVERDKKVWELSDQMEKFQNNCVRLSQERDRWLQEKADMTQRLDRYKDQLKRIEDELMTRSKQMDNMRSQHRQTVNEMTHKYKSLEDHSNQVHAGSNVALIAQMEILLQKSERKVNELETRLHTKTIEHDALQSEMMKVLDLLAEQTRCVSSLHVLKWRSKYPQSFNFEVCVLMCSLMLSVRPFRDPKKLTDASVTERVRLRSCTLRCRSCLGTAACCGTLSSLSMSFQRCRECSSRWFAPITCWTTTT